MVAFLGGFLLGLMIASFPFYSMGRDDERARWERIRRREEAGK